LVEKKKNERGKISRKNKQKGKYNRKSSPICNITFMTELMDGFYTYDSTHLHTHTHTQNQK
jgi:hypothetical protein